MLTVQNRDGTGLTNIGTSTHFRFGNNLGGEKFRDEKLK